MALSSDHEANLFSSRARGTLRLLAYLILATTLMVLDHRYHWLPRARATAAVVVEPVWRLAGLPAQISDLLVSAWTTRSDLQAGNRNLREQLLLANVRIARMQSEVRQNAELKQLLEAARSLQMRGRLARVIDIDLDPFRRRLVLNRGSREGVHVGQVAIDAEGVMGQVVEVLPNTSVVLLITDPSHAIPILDSRTGLRAIAYGTGSTEMLKLPYLSVNAKVRVGDRLLSSGLGGRFPPGFPVAVVSRVAVSKSGEFRQAWARPSAHINRSDQVLLLRDLADPIGPPAPATEVGPPGSLAPSGSKRSSARGSP